MPGQVVEVRGKRRTTFKVFGYFLDGLTGRRVRVRDRFKTRREADLRLKELELKEAKAESLGPYGARRVSLADVLRKHLELCEPEDKPSTFTRKVAAAHALTDYFGTTMIGTLRPETMDQWRAERLAKVKPATFAVEVAVLRAAGARALRWGWIGQNPGLFIKTPRPERRGLPESLDTLREWVWRIMEVADVRFRPVIAAALLTLVRPRSELLGPFGLFWSQVDLRQRLIRLETSKTGDGRIIPLSGPMLDLLRALPRPLDHAARVFDVPYRAHHWDAALTKAGLAGRLDLHQLRSIGASALYDGGVDFYLVESLLGHRVPQMGARYVVIQPERLREPVEVLARWFYAGQEIGQTFVASA